MSNWIKNSGIAPPAGVRLVALKFADESEIDDQEMGGMTAPSDWNFTRKGAMSDIVKYKIKTNGERRHGA